MQNARRAAGRGASVNYDYSLSPEGRTALALGMVALLLGFGAVAAGAYIILYSAMPMIALPGGLPAADRDVVGMFLAGSGALTTLLGGVSLYKSQDM